MPKKVLSDPADVGVANDALRVVGRPGFPKITISWSPGRRRGPDPSVKTMGTSFRAASATTDERTEMRSKAFPTDSRALSPCPRRFLPVYTCFQGQSAQTPTPPIETNN